MIKKRDKEIMSEQVNSKNAILTVEKMPGAGQPSEPSATPTSTPASLVSLGARRRAVVVTALGLEALAVLAHLRKTRRLRHPSGTIYEQGDFVAVHNTWDVILIEAGPGNTATAIVTQQAIEYLQPDAILFIGVAGGIKDVKIGDVVAVTKIYNYESGKADETFKIRPELFHTTYAMEQQARSVLRRGEWLRSLPPSPDGELPKAHIGPMAAGEKVLSSTRSNIYKLLRESYNDALAIEMEGYGFLHAAHVNRQVEALVVRGISDLLDKKGETDKQHFQELAAQNASAFAFEVLAQFD